MEDADEDCTGEITFYEFCNLLAKRIKEIPKEEKVEYLVGN